MCDRRSEQSQKLTESLQTAARHALSDTSNSHVDCKFCVTDGHFTQWHMGPVDDS